MCDYIHWYLFVHLHVLLIFHSAHFPIKVLQELHVWIDACHCYFVCVFLSSFFPPSLLRHPVKIEPLRSMLRKASDERWNNMFIFTVLKDKREIHSWLTLFFSTYFCKENKIFNSNSINSLL